MNKKLQVFVSSTYTDLIEERQTAVEAILDAGHIPAGMELFKSGKPALEIIYDSIDDSDVYMLLLGGRYGSIEKETTLSYTELEYRYAISKKMPVFAILLDQSFLDSKSLFLGNDKIHEINNPNKYENFKRFVKDQIEIKFASNIDQIKIFIHSHLNYIATSQDNNLIGFIRNPQKIFKNIEEVDKYIQIRIKTAQNNIMDLTWKDFYPSPIFRNHRAYMESQNTFLNIIKQKLSQNLEYRHIFTFPSNKQERIQRVHELITYDTYSCGFFDSNVCIFPKLHFVIIDNEEVIFTSSNYDNYLCSIRNRELVGILTTYYLECWKLCLKIKDHEGIHQNNLDLANKYFFNK